jgi:FkbM family methyltransferase
MPFISYAQNYEDVILWRALRDVEQGFYVDVGAADPKEYSVTHAFYERGWSGINIEPLDEYFDKLVQARPDDKNLKVAVGREAGVRAFYTFPSGWSTLNPRIRAVHEASGLVAKKVLIPVLTLGQILEDCVHSTIHFLKIDVEGSETEVLEGLRLDQVRPWIIVVEATEPNSPKSTRHEWEHLLTCQGYGFAYFDGLNCFYVADEVSKLRERLAVQPNVFDNFVVFSDWAIRQEAAKLKQEIVGLISHSRELEESLKSGQAQTAELLTAFNAEKAQAAELLTAFNAEKARTATLLMSQQAEQAHVSNLQSALQAEQVRVGSLAGRILQLEAELAIPSLDRALGRALRALRESGDRLTGGGIRAFAKRVLSAPVKRPVTELTLQVPRPTLDNSALALADAAAEIGNAVSEPPGIAGEKIELPIYSVELSAARAQTIKIIGPDGHEQNLDLYPGRTQRVEIHLCEGRVWNKIKFETNAPGNRSEDDDSESFFNLNLRTSLTKFASPGDSLEMVDGFSTVEVDGQVSHVWAIARQAKLRVINIPEEIGSALYTFALFALDARSIKITQPDGQEQTLVLRPSQLQLAEVRLFGGKAGNIIRFETDTAGLHVEGDSRTLFFDLNLGSGVINVPVPRNRLKLFAGFAEVDDDKENPLACATARKAELHVPDILFICRTAALPASARPTYLQLRTSMLENVEWNRI